jgi:DNA-3-methyladenine glycosylase I
MPKTVRRCHWAVNEPTLRYHDNEWGVPVHNERRLFEFLILEGAQAGLSWTTILQKRENFRKAFDRFDAAKIARYDRRKVRQLLHNPGIIRNRLKIRAAIQNARAFLTVRRNSAASTRISGNSLAKSRRSTGDDPRKKLLPARANPMP